MESNSGIAEMRSYAVVFIKRNFNHENGWSKAQAFPQSPRLHYLCL